MIRNLKNLLASVCRISQGAPSFIAAGAAVALACSGTDESVLATSTSTQAAPSKLLSPEEHEAEFQRVQQTPLSLEERSTVESLLQEQGIDLSEVTFSGRFVVLGDAYLEADALLRPASSAEGEDEAGVEKGRTYSLGRAGSGAVIPDLEQVLPTEPGQSFPRAPDLFSQIFNNVYQFMRPDIDNVTIVVPSAASASFLIPLFQQAAANVVNAATDCLTGISVRTQANYDALPDVEKIILKPIFVRYGTNVCLNAGQTTNGCAIFPRKETREFAVNFSQTRLVPGNRIGIISTRVTPTKFAGKTCINQADCTKYNVGILTHELLHTLGLGHSSDTAHSVRVLGTEGGSFTPSVMQGFCEGNCLFTPALSADDKKTIDTLYSQQSTALYPGGDGCQWRDGVKAIAAIP